MLPFRCSAGHRVQLAFGGEHFRLPCPVCDVDVYRFRDAVPEDDASAQPGADVHAATGRITLSPGAKHVRLAIGGVGFVVIAALFVWHRPATRPAGASAGPVIPIVVAPRPAPVNPAAVSITHFKAIATDPGVVRVGFRLTNAGGVSNGYPGLAVHWHGVQGADQLIGKDSYAHPPLPFTATDVTLDLARPQGATGIDVRITY